MLAGAVLPCHVPKRRGPAYTGPSTFDPQDQNIETAYNYRYDELGNLTHDAEAHIDAIAWTVAGKVRAVDHAAGQGPDLEFAYGASGQRISKQVGGTVGDPGTYREHYIRDAQGNIMATYRLHANGAFRLQERPIYGSSRVGLYAGKVDLYPATQLVPMPQVIPVFDALLRYELTDHLGNVGTVVTGRLLPGDGAPHEAEVISAQGYEPFGSLLPGRNYSSDSYRFGFGGMPKDDEVHGAAGTSYDFGERLYDPRLGRWLSLDPLSAKYPNLSPYAYVENSPIYLRDLDGKEGVVSIKGNTITVTSHIYINGHGATAAKAKSMQRQIMGYWGKPQVYKDPATGQTYNVKFDIQVHKVEPDRPGQPPQEFKEGWNIITLVDPATRPDRRMEDGHFRSYVDGASMRTGEWDATADGETYAHETAHLLKLDDRYVDYTYEDFPGVVVHDRSLIGKIFGGTADNTQRGSLVGAGSGPKSVVQQMVDAIGAYALSTQKDGKATLSSPANLGSPKPHEVGRFDQPPLKIVPHTAH